MTNGIEDGILGKLADEAGTLRADDKSARKRRCSEAICCFRGRPQAGRGNEMSEACIDVVPCKLNNAKLSERTENGRDGNIATAMNLSEAEIHSLKISGS